MRIVVLGGENIPEKRGALIDALEGFGFELLAVSKTTPFSPEKWRQEAVILFIHVRGRNHALLEEHPFKHKNRIINVLFNKVVLNDEFDKAPTIDLIQWRGGAENAHFQKLVTILRTIENEAMQRAKQQSSPPRWILELWAQYKVGALVVAVCSFVLLAFIQNAINAETACSIDFGQPAVSDVCGYFGLGDKPTKTERLAWEQVDFTNCDALQSHARQFPDGAFRSRAIDLFEAGRIKVQTTWEPTTRRTPLFEPEAANGVETEAAGRAALLARVDEMAIEQCTGYTAGDTHRLLSVKADTKSIDCSQSSGKFFCAFDGYAVCELERRVDKEVRICGNVPRQHFIDRLELLHKR